MGKYLDILDRAEARTGGDTSDISDQRVWPLVSVDRGVQPVPTFGRISRFGRSFSELECRCPNHIDPARWQRAVADGGRFLAQWGEQAEALGWTARDIFGLHDVPTNPHPTYQRLSRYDCTGLIWLLQGCSVVALTEVTAAIRMPSGNVTTYRKHNKPAFGRLGDSLDDFVA
jgi:hypothetical protein